MNKRQIIEQYEEFVLPTYSRYDLVIVKGKGSKVWDSEGKEYLDFFPGWAVSGIGHCHIDVVKALKQQLDKIIHVPNNYYNELQGRLAQKLIEKSFPGKVFFCNSGAESVEAVIKLARKYGHKQGRYKIITMEGSFHGRTMGALSATGQDKYKKGFGPLGEGFQVVAFNDLSSLKEKIDDETIAILLELIQGEGGINIVDENYLSEIREICDRNDILLIFDEIQTGMGRTGKLFAYQNYNIIPDAMTLAKSLGAGVPVGALVVGEKYQDVLQSGDHASTFGGNPLVCVACVETLNIIDRDNLLENAKEMGEYFIEKLKKFKQEFNFIRQIRGKGLMLAIELKIEGSTIVDRCLQRGLLINCTQNNILRLLPAMNITKDEVDKGLDVLYGVLKKVK